jgi:hypothetical protein
MAGPGGGAGIMLAGIMNPALRKYEVMTLEEIGKEIGTDPKDAAMDIAIADHGHTGQVTSIMDEGDVRTAVSSPIVMFGSDSEEHAEDGPRGMCVSAPRGVIAGGGCKNEQQKGCVFYQPVLICNLEVA